MNFIICLIDEKVTGLNNLLKTIIPKLKKVTMNDVRRYIVLLTLQCRIVAKQTTYWRVKKFGNQTFGFHLETLFLLQ